MPLRVDRPIYLSGAPVDPSAVAGVCRSAAPFAGLLGASIVGAAAAYFVPKLLDEALTTWRERGQPDDVEFTVEDPGDDSGADLAE
jgi:hypothetical protein